MTPRRSSRMRDLVIGAGAVATGAALGGALEELLYRRVMRRADPEAEEPIGSNRGRDFCVRAPDGTELFCRAFGPADADATIVFAHGITLDHRLWHYQIRDLSDRFRIVAYDARGHGRSGPAAGPDGDGQIDEDILAADLAAVVDQATSGPTVLVGHSMGGMTVQAYLTRREVASGVVGAVLVNTSYRAAPRHAWSRVPGFEGLVLAMLADDKVLDRLRRPVGDLAMLAGRFFFGTRYSPRHVALSVALYEKTPSATLTAARGLLDLDVSEDLDRVAIPLLVVAGTHDRITRCDDSRAIAQRAPGAELVVFEGCGHMSPFERHDELGLHILKFCERVLA